MTTDWPGPFFVADHLPAVFHHSYVSVTLQRQMLSINKHEADFQHFKPLPNIMKYTPKVFQLQEREKKHLLIMN